ncbi:MAG TPA: hypothetical protein VE134_06375, partial [Methanomicrobiales archaeon]|nr:hypothetical protein [Methanomicrobiales archaeon]
MKNMRLFVYAAIAVTLVLACTTASAAAASTISINSTPKLGAFLVNESGMTLYYLAADVPGNGMSNCNSSECPSHWTPFNAS